MKIETNIKPTEAINVIHQAFKRYEADPQPFKRILYLYSKLGYV